MVPPAGVEPATFGLQNGSNPNDFNECVATFLKSTDIDFIVVFSCWQRTTKRFAVVWNILEMQSSM